MHRLALGLLTALFILTNQACNTRQKNPNQPADTTATRPETTPTDASKTAITGRLADLGLTPGSHWRGINLGDDFATVKAAEKGEPFESDAKHAGYTVEFENLESMDVLYYQANRKVATIEVDLFLNARPSVNAYQKELASYFTNRYRTPKPAAGGEVWTGPNGETITMKDVSKGKDFGLKIKIAAGGGATTALAK